jgi:hypothetical protein
VSLADEGVRDRDGSAARSRMQIVITTTIR